MKFVEETREVKFSDFTADPSVSDKNTWFAICCRADFQRVDFLSLNHFMPGWHKSQLGEEMWDKACAANSSALEKRQALRKQKLTDLMEEADPEDPTFEVMFRQLLLEDRLIKAEQLAIQECLKLDVFPENVLADGNCGLWTILQLLEGHPKCLGETHHSLEQSHALRQESCHCWMFLIRLEWACVRVFNFVETFFHSYKFHSRGIVRFLARSFRSGYLSMHVCYLPS